MSQNQSVQVVPYLIALPARVSEFHSQQPHVTSRAADIPDKYTTFTPHERGYRKSVHKVPKWTKVGRYRSALYTPPHLHTSHLHTFRSVPSQANLSA